MSFKKYGVYREIETSKYVDFHTYKYSNFVQAALRYIFERVQKRRIVKFKTFKPPIVLDYSQISDVEVDGVDTSDYPKFCDAFIASATYKGRSMTQDELDALNEDGDFVHNAVYKFLY